MGGGRVFAVGVLLLAGCSTTVGSAAVVIDSTPVTTVAATTTTSTTTAPAAVPSGPDAYAQALVTAWVTGDRPREQQLATPEVVGQLDAHEADRPAGWAFVHCEGTAGSSYCTFAAGTRQLIVRVLDEAAATGQQHGVIEVRFESGLVPGL